MYSELKLHYFTPGKSPRDYLFVPGVEDAEMESEEINPFHQNHM